MASYGIKLEPPRVGLRTVEVGRPLSDSDQRAIDAAHRAVNGESSTPHEQRSIEQLEHLDQRGPHRP